MWTQPRPPMGMSLEWTAFQRQKSVPFPWLCRVPKAGRWVVDGGWWFSLDRGPQTAVRRLGTMLRVRWMFNEMSVELRMRKRPGIPVPRYTASRWVLGVGKSDRCCYGTVRSSHSKRRRVGRSLVRVAITRMMSKTQVVGCSRWSEEL